MVPERVSRVKEKGRRGKNRRWTLAEVEWIRRIVAFEARLGGPEDRARSRRAVARDALVLDLEARRVRQDVGVDLERVDAKPLLVAVILPLLVDIEDRDVELVQDDGLVGRVDEAEAQ